MMSEEEKILRYLNGEMDPKERSAFQLLIHSNEELRKSVEHSRHIKNTLLEENVAFSKLVYDVIKENRKPKIKYLQIAAAVTILLSFSIYFLLPSSKYGSELAMAYLEPYPDVLTSRSGDMKIDLSAYNNGDYEIAERQLESIHALKNEPITALYLAVVYLYNEKAVEALTILENFQDDGTIYEEDLYWYKGLALIMVGRTDEAKTILISLEASGSSYQFKCKEILSELK